MATPLNPIQFEQQPMADAAIEARIFGSFICVLTLLLFVGAYAYQEGKEYQNSSQSVLDAERVRSTVDALYGVIISAEAIQRGYILSGKPALKTDYERAAAHIKEQEHILNDLTGDQKQSVIELEQLIGNRVATLDAHLSLFEHKGLSAVESAIFSNDGMANMLAIHNIVARIDNIEANRLITSKANLKRSLNRTLDALLILFAIAVAVLSLTFASIRRGMLSKSSYHRQLQASEENLSVTLNSIGDAVISTDSAGRITRMNGVAEQLTGWTFVEATGKPVDIVFQIINPETRQPARVPVGDALQSGVTQNLVIDTTLISRNGDERPIADSCAPIRSRDNQVIGAVLVFRDVTEEFSARSALKESVIKAQKANHAKDSFLAMMSHEIRTPLAGILGMLELLSMSELGEEQRSTLNSAWDSSKSLLRIVSDVLDWSKIEAGKLEISPRPTIIPQLLQDVINTYSHVASAKSLTLFQTADLRFNGAHLVDPLRLSQILNNFVSNAIKFTQQGVVALRVTSLECADGKERLKFCVEDTGKGIPTEILPKLFRQYQQESAETARLYGGTGMGLAICRRLAGLMGGEIGVESELGVGSKFWVTLNVPVSVAHDEPVHEKLVSKKGRLEPLGDGGSEAPLVLVVDDNSINRKLLSHQLRLLGLRSETAENGVEALSLWQGMPFALIITDCHMPELDGYSFARSVRKLELDNRSPRIPILGWTANAVDEEFAVCRAAGMDDVLVKPADLNKLRESIARWLVMPPKAAQHLGSPKGL